MIWPGSTYELHKLEWCFYVRARFEIFTSLSMEIPITNCLTFFFRDDGNFYQIILSYSLDRGQNESLIRKLKCNQGYSFKKRLKFTIVLVQMETIST